jgi:hypothetical protein
MHMRHSKVYVWCAVFIRKFNIAFHEFKDTLYDRKEAKKKKRKHWFGHVSIMRYSHLKCTQHALRDALLEISRPMWSISVVVVS